MKQLLIASIFALTLGSTESAFAGLQCEALFPETSVASVDFAQFDFNNLDQPLPKSFSIRKILEQRPDLWVSEDFATSEGRELFRDSNPFMGFFVLGDRFLLATRDPRVARDIFINDQTGKVEFPGGFPPPMTIRELPGYRVFDISKAPFITQQMRSMHGRTAWDEGPNCWNLCQIYKGWAKTAFLTRDKEFTLWTEGPFSKPGQSASPWAMVPSPGDVILFRVHKFSDGSATEVHGAIALPGGLVFTKNGTDYEARYQVTTLSEMMKTYLPALSNTIQFREIRSFEDVWTEWGPKVSPELATYVNRWMAFEKEHADVFFPGPDKGETPSEKFDAVRDLLHQLRQELSPIATERSKAFEGRELNEKEKVEQFFWNMLAARVNSSYH